MIREYFSEVEKKLEEIKWLIKKKNIELNLVSEEMGVIKGKRFVLIVCSIRVRNS